MSDTENLVGMYTDDESAAAAIRDIVDRLGEKEDPGARRVALALADALEGNVPEGHSLRWYGYAESGILDAAVTQHTELDEISAAFIVCWSVYVLPLLPEGDPDGDLFRDPIPLLLADWQWSVVDSLIDLPQIERS